METSADKLPKVGGTHTDDVCGYNTIKDQPIGGDQQADKKGWDESRGAVNATDVEICGMRCINGCCSSENVTRHWASFSVIECGTHPK
jgi:hypothetical protein